MNHKYNSKGIRETIRHKNYGNDFKISWQQIEIGETYKCLVDDKIYEIINIPFMGTGLTYYQISDGENSYFVRNGRWNNDAFTNFTIYEKGDYFEEYNNEKNPIGWEMNVDIPFIEIKKGK
jgi:hypothetical protein